MTEDLAGGGGRPAPRWVRPAGALVLALVVALGAWQARHTAPSPRPGPERTGPVDPAMDFQALPVGGRTGLRLVVGGHTVTEVDLDGGGATQVAGIPAATLGYSLTRTDGGAVIALARPDCPDCPSTAYVLDHGTVTRIEGYDGVVPAARADQLWGFRIAPRQDTTGTVRRLDLAGHPLGPAYRLPAGMWVRRGTVAGLLVVQCCGPNFSLWDPVRGATIRWLGSALAASATRVAWAREDCVLDCPVFVTDLTARAGRQVGVDRRVDVHADGFSRLEVPEVSGVPYDLGAFGGDGTLALLVPRRLGENSTGPTQEVYLIGADRVRRVGGSAVALAVTPAMMWAGDRLVLTLARTGGSPVLSVATATLTDPVLVRAGDGVSGYAAVVR
jgi:hypothetical protein